MKENAAVAAFACIELGIEIEILVFIHGADQVGRAGFAQAFYEAVLDDPRAVVGLEVPAGKIDAVEQGGVALAGRTAQVKDHDVGRGPSAGEKLRSSNAAVMARVKQTGKWDFMLSLSSYVCHSRYATSYNEHCESIIP